MKKTIFTICSIITVCAVVIMACKKEDDSAKKVSYTNQPGYGGGSNPNPTGAPPSGGAVITPTVVVTTYGTFNDGTSKTFTGSTACGAVQWVGTYTGGSVTLSFNTAPTVGTYTTVQTNATAGQVVMNCLGGTVASGGIITVSGTTKLTAAFTSILFGTTPITGSLTCK